MPQPKLVLLPYRYKAGTAYAVIPEDGSGDFTVVRAGDTATRVNSSGLIEASLADIIRIDYANGGCPVILCEDLGINLIEYSADITNPYWTVEESTPTISAQPSPMVGVNFGLITENTNNAAHVGYPPVANRIAADTPFTNFVYARSNGRRYLSLTFGFDSGNGGYVLYDLLQGTINSQSTVGAASITDAQILPGGENSYQCILSGHVTGLPNRLFFVNLIDSPTGIGAIGTKAYAGDGTSGIYVWGADQKAGGLSSHIPTSGATATRNADDISVTVPSGVTEITTTFEDNTTQVVTSIPSTFTLPTGRIKSVVMI